MKSLIPSNDALSLFVDYYEMTSGKANLDNGMNPNVTENYFIRSIPEHLGSYLVVAGLEQVVDYIMRFRLGRKERQWLEEHAGGALDDEFLDYLEHMHFKGDLYAMPEGTLAMPNEPIINITGPSIEVQLFETYILNIMNFQTKIATKASRVVNAARGREVIEFGARRADGRDAAVLGVRASYIAGVRASSLLLACKELGIPFSGTMPHKFVQERASELQAFRDYANSFPDSAVLLIDTYNTINGAKLASIVGKELAAKGHRLAGVRIDSGNLLTLSKKVRKILDSNGLHSTKIIASGDLDEYKIDYLLSHGAPIDSFGVGTRLITGANYNSNTGMGGVSALGGVYKLVEVERGGKMVNTLKVSDDKKKMTLPGRKQVYRRIKHGVFEADMIALWEEHLSKEWKPLLVPVILKGRLVRKMPGLESIRKHYMDQIAMLGEEYKKTSGARRYKVLLSRKLMKETSLLAARLGG